MLIIRKEKIKDWLNDLKDDFTVKDVRKSVLPAKQYFLPGQEDIFKLDKKTQKLSSPRYTKKLVVFGLDWEQLAAMAQLDEIMRKPQPDFFYWQKRDKSFLIGLTDFSIEHPCGDIVLQKINISQYQVLILNEKAKELVRKPFFKRIKNPKVIKYEQKLRPLQKLLQKPDLLAAAVTWSWESNHKIWDELAKRCLGCGICTYVCPICYCFSIEDRVSLDNKQCSRCRYWDACTLPGFSQIAGGHNFHKTIKERYYNWYYHKFVRAYHEFGKSQCVGCGACYFNCPANISIEEVLTEIVKDYKKSLG